MQSIYFYKENQQCCTCSMNLFEARILFGIEREKKAQSGFKYVTVVFKACALPPCNNSCPKLVGLKSQVLGQKSALRLNCGSLKSLQFNSELVFLRRNLKQAPTVIYGRMLMKQILIRKTPKFWRSHSLSKETYLRTE